MTSFLEPKPKCTSAEKVDSLRGQRAVEREEGITAGVSLLCQSLPFLALEVLWGEHGCFLWGGGGKRGAGLLAFEDMHGHPTAQMRPLLPVLMSLRWPLCRADQHPLQFGALGFLSLRSPDASSALSSTSV